MIFVLCQGLTPLFSLYMGERMDIFPAAMILPSLIGFSATRTPTTARFFRKPRNILGSGLQSCKLAL